MLSVKLVRSLVLGETMTNDHLQYDADHDDDHDHHGGGTSSVNNKLKMKRKMKKMPMLLFLPTRELISDTFRLATIARDLGMDFQPNTSLSHLLFSWPSSSSYHHHHTSPSSSSTATNHRTSVSSQTSTFTITSSSTTTTTALSAFQNDAVPIPFPSLSTTSSLSLLRSFISLSKGLFKLVFLDISPNSNPNFVNYYHSLLNYDTPVHFSLFSRVTGKRVKSIDELSTELAGKGWSLYRSPKLKVGSLVPLVLDNPVYLFRKTDSNRVLVKGMGNVSGGGGGECRVRELRLPALDFEKGVNLRVLLYILLMTDDVFYLA